MGKKGQPSQVTLVWTAAPAKINWTLEVLGRRDDGYHEIRSVMQTIDLCDDVSVGESDELRLEVGGELEAGEDDLALKAARLLAEKVGRELPALIRIEKRIPVASGLGGGSSDAAAVLRLLNRLHGLRLSREEMAELAAGVGSDAPFFVYGGTALVKGRGERVTRLPDVPEAWFVLLVPPVSLAGKTRRMYEALSEDDFGGGLRTKAIGEAIKTGGMIEEGLLFNGFERAADDMFEGLDGYREALLEAGARAVHLAGSGPGLYALAPGEKEAGKMASGVKLLGGRIFVARTMGAQEATGVVVNG